MRWAQLSISDAAVVVDVNATTCAGSVHACATITALTAAQHSIAAVTAAAAAATAAAAAAVAGPPCTLRSQRVLRTVLGRRPLRMILLLLLLLPLPLPLPLPLS